MYVLAWHKLVGGGLPSDRGPGKSGLLTAFVVEEIPPLMRGFFLGKIFYIFVSASASGFPTPQSWNQVPGTPDSVSAFWKGTRFVFASSALRARQAISCVVDDLIHSQGA